MNELYYLSVECKNNYLSQDELITKITNLRGGSFVDLAAGLAIIAAIIILANKKVFSIFHFKIFRSKIFY